MYIYIYIGTHLHVSCFWVCRPVYIPLYPYLSRIVLSSCRYLWARVLFGTAAYVTVCSTSVHAMASAEAVAATRQAAPPADLVHAALSAGGADEEPRAFAEAVSRCCHLLLQHHPMRRQEAAEVRELGEMACEVAAVAACEIDVHDWEHVAAGASEPLSPAEDRRRAVALAMSWNESAEELLGRAAHDLRLWATRLQHACLVGVAIPASGCAL